ncbi:MAG: hypothetical protein IPJ58_02555 [Ardenticatenia bacterium]|nr:hypothetical protein [Ardenticatenia bacterium]
MRAFLNGLGQRQTEPEILVLLGGSALLLLGSQRTTLDIDYVGDDLVQTAFQDTIHEVATELELYADPVPIAHFVPIPADSKTRQLFVDRYGKVDVFVIDPYVIALSKLDRGIDSDIADIVFLLERGFVELESLADRTTAAIEQAAAFDLDPIAMQRHLSIVRQRFRSV